MKGSHGRLIVLVALVVVSFVHEARTDDDKPKSNPHIKLIIGTSAQDYADDKKLSGGAGPVDGFALIYCDGDPIDQYDGGVSIQDISHWAVKGENTLWLENHSTQTLYVKIARQVGEQLELIGKGEFEKDQIKPKAIQFNMDFDYHLPPLEPVPSSNAKRDAIKAELARQVNGIVSGVQRQDIKPMVEIMSPGRIKRFKLIDGIEPGKDDEAKAKEFIFPPGFAAEPVDQPLMFIFGRRVVYVARQGRAGQKPESLIRLSKQDKSVSESRSVPPLAFVKLDGRWTTW